MRDANMCIIGWYLELQPYDFTIFYRAGKANPIEVLYPLGEEGGKVTEVCSVTNVIIVHLSYLHLSL